MSHKSSGVYEPEQVSTRVSYATLSPGATFLKLKYIIILFLLLTALIPGFFGLAGVYETSKKELIKSKGLYFEEVASFAAFQVEHILNTEVDTIRWIADLPTVKNLFSIIGNLDEKEKLRKIILPALARRYFVTNIYSPSGELLFSSEIAKSRSALRQDQLEAIEETLQTGKVYISDVLEISEPEERLYIEIYAPIGNDSKQIIGVIEAQYEIDELMDTIRSVRIGRTGHANLIASTGSILVCPIFPPRSHQVGRDLLNDITKGSHGWTVAKDDGHGASGSIIGFAPVNLSRTYLSTNSLGQKQWYVFTRQEPYETFELVKKFQSTVTIYSGIFVALVLGLVVFAFKQILKAQKAHESEVIYKGKADSIKQLLANFQSLMLEPLEEFRQSIHELEPSVTDNDSRYIKLKKMGKNLMVINSLVEHLAYYSHAKIHEPEPVDLERVVTDSMMLLDYVLTRKEIDITLNKPDKPVILESRAKLLNIVIMNLLLNATHAVEKLGKITITLGRSNGLGICKIEDNGSGMPPEEIGKIFNPFFTTKKGRHGHGLGLSVSRGIIEEYGGQITIDSSKGKGTSVKLKLKIWDRS